MCAVGPWVAAAGGRVRILVNRDVSRRANAAEDTLILPCWHAGQSLFMSAVCNDQILRKYLPDVVELSHKVLDDVSDVSVSDVLGQLSLPSFHPSAVGKSSTGLYVWG